MDPDLVPRSLVGHSMWSLGLLMLIGSWYIDALLESIPSKAGLGLGSLDTRLGLGNQGAVLEPGSLQRALVLRSGGIY